MSFQDTLNDSIFVTANGSIFSASMGGSAPFATLTGGVGKNSASATICWKPACHQVRSAPYIFTVNAADKNCGNTEKTFSIAVKAMGSSTVSNLRCADIQSNSSIALTWVNPADISNVRGYRIYRRIAGTGSFTYVDSTSGPTITTLADNSVSNAYGNQYQYMIRTVNKCDSLSPGDTITTIDVQNIKTYTYQSEARWNRLKRNFNNLYKSFEIFINRTPLIGKSFVCVDDKFLKKILKKKNKSNIITYGFKNGSDLHPYNVKNQEKMMSFDISIKLNDKVEHIKNIKFNLS